MKRSPIKRSTTPMKRSRSMKRAALLNSAGPLMRSSFARKSPKMSEARKPKAPKAAKRRGRATAAEKDYMGRVAAFGCVLCRLVFGLCGVPAHVHHLKAGGGSKRASHFDTMPLCPEHHIGATGIHMLGQDGFERMYGISETALLSWFKARIGGAHG